ncbi:FAD-dependent monooxygenase [Urbifossiella limnaea]|uniref:Pentachlorophenol 4-monooxygenase n=1 Tax=Urbifossiella limnaea TaxID=2528023 RepID=A0A517XYV1_9BACT|nr:FAD-dependent monooxygenase [Urbifossiella limnaea]QDU22671.1 Pentachlorophenol 4-monooxygenase [Urbifossiella limnaea]
MTGPEVFVAGAGPTGLVLALWLARAGVRPRVVDKAPGPGLASRAMAVQARVLEFYRQLGVADGVVAGGLLMSGGRFWDRGRLVARFSLGDIGAGISPFPFVLSYPQDDHERYLLRLLGDAGVAVEWNTELVGVRQTPGRVFARLRAGGTESESEHAYLCGCDGSHSAVRRALGVGFPGAKYDSRFYVADVAGEGWSPGAFVNASLGRDTFCLGFPVRRDGMVRLIGILPAELAERTDLTFDDVRPIAEQLLGLRTTLVNWFSTYHVHHRVAERFRVGRAFLAGDAGHVHSPAGGQGMNTGIGDAVNLAWKLAAALRGTAAPDVLDSYEAERIRFARVLVDTTDRAFGFLVGGGVRGWLMRRVVMPRVLPLAVQVPALRRQMFRLISQTRIEYRPSPLSAGGAGRVRAGDRLPWLGEPDNFAPLANREWQLHVYGDVGVALRDVASRAGLRVERFAWSAACRRVGVARDAIYLVRPDGHVGFAGRQSTMAEVEAYLARWAIRGG